MIPIILWGGSASERQASVKAAFSESDYMYSRTVAEKTSITIAQVHDLIAGVTAVAALKPRLIWIEDAHLLTVPAQNALLKILEEPPSNIQFVLTTLNKNSLLATICSRCRLIAVTQDSDTKGDGSELALIKQAMAVEAGYRINLADSVGRKREDVLVWTESCLHDIQSKLNTEKSPAAVRLLAKIAGSVHAAYSDLKANVSPSLVMQNLFLSLPHTKRQ